MDAHVSIEKTSLIMKAQQKSYTSIITKKNQEESPSGAQKAIIPKWLSRKE